MSLMGIQGGAQFRAANTPVEGTGVPSKVNNFAVDAHYGFELGSAGTLLLGGSYLRGTAYCQDFPVVHFEPCQDNNPALDVYGKLVHGDFTFKGEFARTTDEWPGTFNPDIPQFAASKVTSFDIGARYRYDSGAGPVDLSAEFSRFVAGPHGAPWEHQDQFVLGAAWFVRPSAKLFAEYIRANGFAPLNFISGGSVRGDESVVPAPVLKTETQVEVPHGATPLVLVRSAWGAPKSVGSNGEIVFRLKGERASVRGRRLDVQPSMSATLTPRILVLPFRTESEPLPRWRACRSLL